MRESCTYGSVRGASSNGGPYRNRREFLAGLGAAAVWPHALRAQQPVLRRVGVLIPNDEGDPDGKARLAKFAQGLAELGWTDGRNVRMDVRWGAGNVGRMRMFAKDLIDLQAEIILSNGTPATAALQRETQTIPIVFVNVADPIGSGFVAGLPHPGGNITGFISQEASLGGKWLELLTEIAPDIQRVAAMFNPDTAPDGGAYYLPSFEAAARLLKVEPITAPVHSDAEIETVINTLGRGPRSGLVVMPDGFMLVHRAPTISLATRNNIPMISQLSVFARDGGLLSYGPDFVDIFRRSASYVDLILRGAKPADLPVQLHTKFEMILNAKAAKALGITVPQSILLRADEVIE
jgi:putative tryptophan/tyrosine transport system substrate-binding protein